MNDDAVALKPWGKISATSVVSRKSSPARKPAQGSASSDRKPRKAIVFVHGIFSSHKTFSITREYMMKNPLLAGVELHYFDYPYNEPMESNGRILAQLLRAEGFEDNDQVAIVAHSMGGLISRFAVLSELLKFVRIVFLLGTPNAGAIRLSQLSALAQLAHKATNKAFSLYPRLSGVVSLSNTAALFEAKRKGFVNAADVDYVSIPGRFYHADRNYWELPESLGGLPFSAFEAILMRTALARMERPHDGIVEESSNNLAKCPRGTEKQDSYGGYRGKRPASYAHLTLARCSDLNHVEIHADDIIVDVVSEIIAKKFSDPTGSGAVLEKWFEGISPDLRLSYGVQMAFDH